MGSWQFARQVSYIFPLPFLNDIIDCSVVVRSRINAPKFHFFSTYKNLIPFMGLWQLLNSVIVVSSVD